MDGRLFYLLKLCVTALTNTPAYLSASLRTPRSMASDFTLGFYLRPTETNHAAGAQLWFVLGDSATRGNFIRAGVDFGAGQLRLLEGKSGLSAAVPLAVLPQDFASGTLTYKAATKRLDFALGGANVSLTLGGS